MNELFFLNYIRILWFKILIFLRKQKRKRCKDGHPPICAYEIADPVNKYGVKCAGTVYRVQCERCGAKTRWMKRRQWDLFFYNQQKYWPIYEEKEEEACQNTKQMQ